jgi:hypothetical protein
MGRREKERYVLGFAKTYKNRKRCLGVVRIHLVSGSEYAFDRFSLSLSPLSVSVSLSFSIA